MAEIKPSLCLTASWKPGQNPFLDNPTTLTWNDGSAASLDEYAEHMSSTHSYERDGSTGAVVLRMWPEVVADLRWDGAVRAWTVSGPCVVPATLPYVDRDASNEEIVAALFRFETVYRAGIFRGDEVNPPVRDAARVIRIVSQNP